MRETDAAKSGPKYRVTRTDGAEHQGCRYYVLDLDHDDARALIEALLAYLGNLPEPSPGRTASVAAAIEHVKERTDDRP